MGNFSGNQLIVARSRRRPKYLSVLQVASFLVLSLSFTTAAWAGTLTWTGGTGNWQATNLWSSSSWTDGNNAVFGAGIDTAGTVTITTTVAPTSLTFNPTAVGNYTISGGSIDLGTGTNTFTTNVNASISSVIFDSGGLTKAGTGMLTLSGNNTFSGSLIVASGSLSVATWNGSGAAGPLGMSSLPVTLGTASSTGVLVYTGAQNTAVSKSLYIAPGGGEVVISDNTPALALELSSGAQLSGGGPLTVETQNTTGNTFARFILTSNVGQPTYFSGTVAVMPYSQYQANFQLNQEGVPYGAGSNGLGPTITMGTGSVLDMYAPGASPIIDIGSISGSGTLNTEAGSPTWKIGGDNTNATYAGQINQLAGSTTSLIKTGSGAWTLGSVLTMTYTGSTTIANGTLNLDFTQPGAVASNMLAPNSPLVLLGGGTLNVNGKASATSSQAANGLTVNPGSTGISVVNGASGTANLTLGTITRNVGGTVNFVPPATGSITTTSSFTTNGILTSSAGVAYATVGGADWAALSGAGPYSIAGYSTLSSYATNNFTSAANNVDVTSSQSPASFTVSTLRFNAANASTLALSSAGASVLGAGGLLVTGNVGNNPTIISGGTLEGAAGAELVVIQNNSANSLTISSAIANSGVSATAFTKAGPGILYLTGTNTYTGGTYVSGGTLSVSSWNVSTNGVFGNSALPVTISNGDLQYTGNSATVNRPFSIPANSQGYIEVTNSASTLALDGANLNTGSGNLIKIGPGTLRIAGPNYAQTSFTGHVIVNAGTLDFYNGGSMYGQATATPNDIQINNGAAIEFDYPSGGTIPTADGIQLSGSATINVTAATQTFNGTVANVSASATGSLTKAGAGILALGGVNTWTGGTTVSGGTLTLNSAVLGNVADNAYLSLATSSVAAAMPGSITISVSGAAGASYAIDQNFVNAIAATSSGEIALGVSSSNNLNFSTAGLSSAMLGALGSATTYSGVLTPANSSYRFGGVTGTLTVSSSLADSGGPTSLVLNPYGTSSVLYLTGSNTYTGGTFINGGILEAYTPSSMGATSGSVNVAAGATLDLAVGGSGQWSNSNIVTLLSSSSVMFSSGAGFGLDTTGGSANYSGNLPSGNVVFTKYGPNFLMLTGSNSYTGSTIVTGGTLQLGDGATTNSPNSSSGFIINSGANLTFANPFTQAYVGNIGGAGSLTKFGASLLTLSGTAINYSGATAISGGTLVLSGGSTALLTSGITIAGGAQLTVLNGPATASYLGSGAISNSGVLSVTGGPSYAFGLSNAISGSGSLNVLGYETNLNAPLSISGDTTLNAVYLVCEAANRLSPNGRLVINAGNVDMSNGNQTVAGLAGAGGGIYSFGDTGTTGLTINLASGTQIYYGNLGSNFPGFSVTKTGSGTQVFAGAVTYTGSTNVAAGSLFVNGSGTSSVTVANNATFGGSGSDGPTTVSSGGNIQAGYNSAGSLSLSSLNFAGSANLSVGNIGGSSPSILTVTGSNGLTTNGAGSIAVNVGSLAVTSTGSYEVVGYSGAIQGTGSSAFVVGTLPARVIGTLVGGNNQIQLDVTAFDYPIWTGSVTNNWDTSTSNWVLAVAGTATTFLPNDNVLFNDTAGTTTVNIPSNVSPGSVTFSNTSVSYTLTSSTGTGGITGTTGLLKTGAGLLTITNTNSFTGPVMINGGTISVGSIANSGIASPLGAGSSIVFGGGVLNYTGSSASTNDNITLNSQGSTILIPAAQTLTLGGSIAGTGGLAFNSAAILSLTGGLSYSGSTILSNGTLSEASYNTSGATILSGSSTLIYSGANTANATKGIAMAGPATINVSSATGVLNMTSAGSNLGFTGSGTLTKNGPGLFEIGAGGIANQYFTGKSIINAGTVEYYGQGSMYSPSVLTPAQITINNGGTASFAYPGGSALSANIGFQISGNASISSGATFPSTQNIQGVIADGSSPGNLIKTGPGVLSIGGIATYSGSTAIQNGILQIYGGPGNKLPIGTTITFGTSSTGGTLDLFGVSQQVAGLAVASGANPGSQVIGNSYTGSSGTLVVNGASSSTFGGTIIDAIGNTTKKTYLTLSGGTLVLTGSNSYSGATTINGGSLIAGAAGALSHSSTVNVYNGLLDATAAPQTVAALNIYGGQLNLNAANLLTSNAYSTLGGTLNVYEATPGTAELISLPSGYTGTFTPGSLPANYSLYYGNSNQVDLVLATVSNSAAWNSSLGGSWTSGSNWLPATVPNAQAATALLGGALTASGTVTLDGSQTVGTLTFSNSTASYTLAAGNSGSLTLDNTGGTGSSQIIVWAGTHSITAPLTIANGPAFVSLINSGSLDISGNIGEAGGSHSLVLSSSDATGVLSLDGSNTFSGGVYVNSGTLILNGAAALAPGSTLVIGMSSTASMPTVISSPVAAPTATLAPVPEPGTLTLFGVAALWSAIACYRFSKRPPLLEGRVA